MHFAKSADCKNESADPKPDSLQRHVILLAHDGHQGIVKTKVLLRSKVWFPNIDKKVESFIATCESCQINTSKISFVPFQMSKMPSGPWKYIDIDYYGSPSEVLLIVLIDEYSRYPIVKQLSSTSADTLIPCLHEIFSAYGIPVKFKTDNGPSFNGSEFDKFCITFGINHQCITPYWPRANGEVERFMPNLTKVFKNAITKNIPWKMEFNFFLSAYRATPHSSTDVAPSSLIFKYSTSSRLSILDNHYQKNNLDKIACANDAQARLIMQYEVNSRLGVNTSNFSIGDLVLYQPPQTQIHKKSTPNRWLKPLKIVGIKNSMITVANTDTQFTRNFSHFRLFRTSVDQDVNLQLSNKIDESTTGQLPIQQPLTSVPELTDTTSLPSVNTESPATSQPRISRRNKKPIRKNI